MTQRWLIVADDLTGAADAGVAFAQRGCATEVTWGDTPPPPGVTVHALDLDSRGRAALEAFDRHHEAVERWLGTDCALYKKMDSTLRGQPALEIAALCAALRARRRPAWGILAPANPAMGRTTRDGHVYVRGEPLEHTDTWKREHTYDDADLEAMLASAELRAIKLPLARLRDDPAAVAAALRSAASADHEAGTMLVCDAETDEDLRRIVAAADTVRPGFFAGTAGLARALAAAMPAADRGTLQLPATKRGTLIAVGTPARISRDAAERLAQHLGGALVRVAMDSPIDGPSRVRPDPELANRVMRGDDVVVRLDGAEGAGPAPDPSFVHEFSRTLVPALRQMGGLIVSGGETARALLDAIQVGSLTLLDEIEPGMALGVTRGKVAVPIVTKPGAFGDEQSLVRCLHRMRALRRPS